MLSNGVGVGVGVVPGPVDSLIAEISSHNIQRRIMSFTLAQPSHDRPHQIEGSLTARLLSPI